MKWEKVGTISVDAGLVWVGDPCYCVTPDCGSHPAETWSEFCNIIFEEFDNLPVCKEFDSGFCVSTLHGDGGYPVYVKRDREGIHAIKVEF